MSDTAQTYPLGNRAREVLQFLHQYRAEHGYAPSIRKLATHLRTSTSVANYYLKNLESRGLIFIPREDGIVMAHTMYLTTRWRAVLDAEPNGDTLALNAAGVASASVSGEKGKTT
jgi:SOS-response transcriptional repressor LexA